MPPATNEQADICIIVEGAFPYVVGGVASWLADLIAGLGDLRFHVVAIKADAAPLPWRVQPPANVTGLTEVALWPGASRNPHILPDRTVNALCDGIESMIGGGGIEALLGLVRYTRALRAGIAPGDILDHRAFFTKAQALYRRTMPSASFHHFFWAWRSLIGGLLSMLLAPLPRARVYHTISTGFAGLLAARARIETGRPAFLTEHGIYLLERQIEIMMAAWIGDRIESGLTLDTPADDLRDIWLRAFDSYARTCYQACDPIVALYGASNTIQQRLGATATRVRAIPNGVDHARFAALPDARVPDRPVVALIGRVVEIKDVKTYIRACAMVHRALPHATFFILGPTEENPAYAAECRTLVTALGLDDAITFTGRVDILEWLPRIDLVVLTSLSEAQPLVILEAGAAGIPIVAPDVGCCRELIEGRPDQPASPGAGGIVTALANPQATGDAIVLILSDYALRREMGRVLQRRGGAYYNRAEILRQYRDLYLERSAAPIRSPF
ncbi:GT4 family glycosyltransferase PelF [Sphingomonas solaris]|uniref:DUF3492 domain-containing protein n=1 Tax=Alterirhizorhabdus solaris TaxID=2529389 RepID=A0A558QW53_9SPHN|nr:GT4 family glycosyltransferase PelF [Sphingomonas solaris]TVV71386.1 DUF3492 domain-containing protein [Sphingomonas solaris]